MQRKRQVSTGKRADKGRASRQRRTEDGLEAVRTREAVDGLASNADALDGPAQRDDECLHVLLVDRLDECVERTPGRADDVARAVVKEGHELPDEVDHIIAEVGLGRLAEAGIQVAARDALGRQLVLAQREHVHLQAAEPTLVVFDRREDRVQGRVERLARLLVLLRFERALQRVDDVGETTTERRTGDADKRRQSAGIEGRDGLGREAGHEDGEDLLGADLHDLAERLEGSVGGRARRLERVEEGRDRLVDGMRADDLLRDVEGLPGSRADARVRVDERCADCRDDGVLLCFECRLARVGHELRKRETHTLALATVVRAHRLLEDGDDLAEDGLAEATARVGQAARGGLALLERGARKDAHDDRHCSRQGWVSKRHRGGTENPGELDVLSTGRISRTVRGVFETSAFHTPIAAWRTPPTASWRTM